MIEKITPDHILGLDGLPTTIMPDSAKLMQKINELVDAVNELQNRIDPPSVYQVMKDKDAIIGKHIGEKQRLQDELDRTKKQLEIANDTLRHADWFFDGDYVVYAKDMHKEIKYAIKAISNIADYGQPIQELDNE